jgi:hypothetical protein
MKKIIDIITKPWRWWKEHRAYKKRLEELRKRDPFIYK